MTHLLWPDVSSENGATRAMWYGVGACLILSAPRLVADPHTAVWFALLGLALMRGSAMAASTLFFTYFAFTILEWCHTVAKLGSFVPTQLFFLWCLGTAFRGAWALRGKKVVLTGQSAADAYGDSTAILERATKILLLYAAILVPASVHDRVFDTFYPLVSALLVALAFAIRAQSRAAALAAVFVLVSISSLGVPLYPRFDICFHFAALLLAIDAVRATFALAAPRHDVRARATLGFALVLTFVYLRTPERVAPPQAAEPPPTFDATLGRAIHLYHRGKYEESLDWLIKANQMKKYDSDVLLYAGRLRATALRKNEPQIAVTDFFLRSYKADPTNREAANEYKRWTGQAPR